MGLFEPDNVQLNLFKPEPYAEFEPMQSTPLPAPAPTPAPTDTSARVSYNRWLSRPWAKADAQDRRIAKQYKDEATNTFF